MSAAFDVLPPGGLEQSILLPVLVGVWIALLCTETLGWVFVGLVVPGYLASVLVVQPTTAAVIVLEAVMTWAVARALSYALAPTGVWAPFFGRDRFFLIVMVSVIVRQHDQLWLLPALATWLERQVGAALPPVREFYSIGLVLVPLTANMLWKPGLRRGLVQLAVVVGLTWAALAHVLLPWTNLSLGSFELLYEDTAIDFLGNAKAYVLLLTIAALAARFNLRYGWDFGGILVPALLGLLWFSPRDLAVTLAEACALAACTALVLRLTPLGRLGIEGPRRFALVLTLGIALKWLLSLAIGANVPGLRARELFGFGYLLSSILALRMLARGSARRVVLPALTTASLGWALGSAVGFGLELVAPSAPPTPPGGPQVASLRLLRTDLGALALARTQAELAPPQAEPPAPAVLAAHADAWTAVAAWLEDPDPARRAEAEAAAARADLVLHPLATETGPIGHDPDAPGATGPAGLAAPAAESLSHGTGPIGQDPAPGPLRPATGPAGRAAPGTALVSPGTDSPGAPAPAALPGPGASITSYGPGPEEHAAPSGSGSPTMSPGTGPASRPGFVLLASERGAVGAGLPVALLFPGAPGPVLAVPRPVAEGQAVAAAGALCRALRCRAVLVAGRDDGGRDAADPFAVALRRAAPDGALLLRADDTVPEDRPVLHAPGGPSFDARALRPAPAIVATPAPEDLAAAATLRVHPRALEALLRARAAAPRRAPALLPWLAERTGTPRERPLAPGVPPSLAELVFLERRVAAPVVTGDAAGLAATMAALVDYEVWEFADCGAGRPCRALAEAWRPAGAGWGILVVDPAATGPILEVPHALGEVGTWRLGAELFAAAGGQALVLAPRTEPGHPFTPAQALHQAAASAPGPRTVLQIRGLGPRAGLSPTTVVIGLGRPALHTRPLPPVLEDILAPEGLLGGPPWVLADGSPDLAPLAGAGNPQLEFSTDLAGDTALVVWFPPALRRVYGVPDPCPELARLAALDLVAGEDCAAWQRDELAALRGAPDEGPPEHVPGGRMTGSPGHAPADSSSAAPSAPAPGTGAAGPSGQAPTGSPSAGPFVPAPGASMSGPPGLAPAASPAPNAPAPGAGTTGSSGHVSAGIPAPSAPAPGAGTTGSSGHVSAGIPAPSAPAPGAGTTGSSGHVSAGIPAPSAPAPGAGTTGLFGHAPVASPALGPAPARSAGSSGPVPGDRSGAGAPPGPGARDRRDARVDLEAARLALEDYAETGNLHLLRAVAAAPGVDLRAGLGKATARAFLAVCEDVQKDRCALVWLGPAEPGAAAVSRDPAAQRRALWTRRRALVVEEDPR